MSGQCSPPTQCAHQTCGSVSAEDSRLNVGLSDALGGTGILQPETKMLDWNDAISADPAVRKELVSLLAQEIRPDVILGADIVYDISLIVPALETMWQALISGALSPDVEGKAQVQRHAWIALSVRRENTLDEFLKQAGMCPVTTTS